MLFTWLRKGRLKDFTPPVESVLVQKNYLHLGGAFTIREEISFQIRNPPLGELEDEWMSMLSHVGPLLGNCTKPWLWSIARPIRVKWKPKEVGGFLSVDHLQSLVDSLYYRTDDSVEFGERLNWPVVWPRGTYVDIVQSSDVPQLEPRLSLRGKLKTPQPARVLRHSADLARVPIRSCSSFG